jgi:hypothetical protein
LTKNKVGVAQSNALTAKLEYLLIKKKKNNQTDGDVPEYILTF